MIVNCCVNSAYGRPCGPSCRCKTCIDSNVRKGLVFNGYYWAETYECPSCGTQYINEDNAFRCCELPE